MHPSATEAIQECAKDLGRVEVGLTSKSAFNMLCIKVEDFHRRWKLLIGIVLAEAAVALIGYGQSDALRLSVMVLLCAGGFLVCVGGMFLIRKEPFRVTIRDDEAALDGRTAKCKETALGRINLNGYFFEAYEEEAGNGGWRFRLRPVPSINPEREAGFIRYLIHEGFVEKRWPRLSRKIEEEASLGIFL